MSLSRLLTPTVLSLAVVLMPWVAIAEEDPTIQIAILLDSSNSMDGLIDQTRSQLWNVVNALPIEPGFTGQYTELVIATSAQSYWRVVPIDPAP